MGYQCQNVAYETKDTPYAVKEKNIQQHLLKMLRQTLSRTIAMGIGTTAMGFYSGERDWAQLQIQHGQVGIYSQGAGWRSGDGKLLKGNIRSKWDSG